MSMAYNGACIQPIKNPTRNKTDIRDDDRIRPASKDLIHEVLELCNGIALL